MILFDELWDIAETFLSVLPTKIGCVIRGIVVGLLSKKFNIPNIRRNCHIFRPWNLHVGRNVGIGRNSIINCVGSVSLGDNVRLGPNIMISTLNHNYYLLDKPIAKQGARISPVIINDDVWIGANVSILTGITIGKGVVIGAGSVVTKDIPPYAIAAGVPAKVIKLRNN